MKEEVEGVRGLGKREVLSEVCGVIEKYMEGK